MLLDIMGGSEMYNTDSFLEEAYQQVREAVPDMGSKVLVEVIIAERELLYR